MIEALSTVLAWIRRTLVELRQAGTSGCVCVTRRARAGVRVNALWHVPPFRQGLDRHSSVFDSQMFPKNPCTQEQAYLSADRLEVRESEHVAPFMHGDDRHSSMSRLQSPCPHVPQLSGQKSAIVLPRSLTEYLERSNLQPIALFDAPALQEIEGSWLLMDNRMLTLSLHAPVYPALHTHVYSNTPSMHVPPF